MELAVGGFATWLFAYNRENFMFDKEQYLKREYQGQGMKIKQFELYREDVRDLIELTVSKMDNYMIVATLLLGFCVQLFTMGRPKPGVAGSASYGMNWLYAVTTVGAFMYFLLAIWLALHASVAAHSFGVRLLTQFVRLPVPTTQQIEAARAKATDYEALGAKELFRLPVLRQQLRRMNSAMTDLTQNARGPATAESDAMSDGCGESSDGRSAGGAPLSSPVAMLEHVRLYRQLQANWQAYDAYARVSMAMGTQQLLHALGYYCLYMLVAENHDPLPGIACVAVFTSCMCLLIRLDLYLSTRLLYKVYVVVILAPLLAVLPVAVEVARAGSAEKRLASFCFPLAFFIHFVWVAFTLDLAKAEHVEDVSLPTNFRTVLYLDVFGWLSSSSPEPARSAAADAPAAPAGAPLEVWPEESSNFGSSGDLVMMRQTSSRSGTGGLPKNLRESLASNCRQLARELHSSLARWECAEVQELLADDDGTRREINNLRQRLVAAEADVERECSGMQGVSDPARQSARDADRIVWLKLEWNPSGSPVEFYYRCDTGDSIWTHPDEPDTVSDIESLKLQLLEVLEKVRALVDSNPCADGTCQDSSGELFGSSPTGGRRAEGPVSPSAQSSAPNSSTQQTRFGGSEAVHLGDGSAIREQFFSHSPDASQTFHPHRMPLEPGTASSAQARTSRAPGQIPWLTFRHGSLTLVVMWGAGTLWALMRAIWPQLDIPVSPAVPSDVAASRLHLEKVFDGPWSNPYVNPKSLACNDAMGSTLLVAEAYAVHEISLSRRAASSRPALAACLENAPAFQAAGLRGMSLTCSDHAEDCTAALLGSEGTEVLRCRTSAMGDLGLAEGLGTILSSLLLHGGPWRTLTLVDSTSVWASRGSNEAVSRLGRRQSAKHEFVPELDFPHAAFANVTQLHWHAGVGLLGLEPGRGRLHAWLIEAGGGAWPQHHEWELPGDVRWEDVCSTSEALHFVGVPRDGHGSAGIWSAPLTAELRREIGALVME